MSDIAIQHTCSDESGLLATPEGDAETCYNMFVAKLPQTVPEDEALDWQNFYLYLAARGAGEDAQEQSDWPQGYSIQTNAVVFSRQSSTGWDYTRPGCAVALLDENDTVLFYFGVETLN